MCQRTGTEQTFGEQVQTTTPLDFFFDVYCDFTAAVSASEERVRRTALQHSFGGVREDLHELADEVGLARALRGLDGADTEQCQRLGRLSSSARILASEQRADACLKAGPATHNSGIEASGKA